MQLPRLYAIADIQTLRRHGVALDRFSAQLVTAGAEILQLRHKDGSPQEILAEAAVITEHLSGSACLPVMNDRADLAVLAGWRAVHVGHLDMPPDAVRQVLGTANGPALAGVSTHQEEQVAAADAGSADYVAVGPVFQTGTKADAEPVIGVEGVRRLRAVTRKPLVAIGGISLENAAAVIEAGADAVAVISGLFAKGTDVEGTGRDFLRRLR